MCLFQFWFPQGICLGVGLLRHMAVLFLVFKGISIPSSIVAVSIYIPINSAGVFPFLHTLSKPLLFVELFDDGHSDWCEVVSHCSFDLHFSSNKEELKCLLMEVKEESEKVGLKFNKLQKTKIMASGPITSWQIDEETVEIVSDFIFWGLQNDYRC